MAGRVLVVMMRRSASENTTVAIRDGPWHQGDSYPVEIPLLLEDVVAGYPIVSHGDSPPALTKPLPSEQHRNEVSEWRKHFLLRAERGR